MVGMQRSLEPFLKKDLNKKIILLSGPRQVGKTTLAKSFYPENTEYFNVDRDEHRLLIRDKSWRRDCDLVIFDEFHKIKKWKSWIKGVYDTEGVRPRLLVTGSARLEAFKKGGESLAGRFYSYRLYPFSVAELKEKYKPEEALEGILKFGGFPEPFLQGSEDEAKRWRRSHLDRIIREDLLDLTAVRDLKGIETMVELLKISVGSPVSYESLARDLHISPNTAKHWIALLESLYVIFLVTPYARNIARSLLKQPKIYFYDTGAVIDEPGPRFENAVACALLKRLHFLEDAKGEKNSLHYLRDKEKREVDFLTVRDGRPEWLVEAKTGSPSAAHLKYFSDFFGNKAKPVLLVKDLQRELQLEGIPVKKAAPWLQSLET